VTCRYQESFENTSPEKKKQLLLSKCEALQQCADTFVKASESFAATRAKLSQFDGYLQTLVDASPPPKSVRKPSKLVFISMTNLSSLNDLYEKTDFFYKRGSGPILPLPSSIPNDDDIKNAIEERKLKKSNDTKSKESLDWYISTIDTAISDTQTFFGEEPSALGEQISQLQELQSVLQEMKRHFSDQETSTCAEKVFIVEQQHKWISAQEAGVAMTARGEFADTPLEQRASEAEDALRDSRIDTGSDISLLTLPRDFKEQCIFLSQIFQFTEFHRDFQGGTLSESTVGVTDVEARMSINAIQGAGTGNAENITLKKLPYAAGHETNSSLVVEGQPFGFINKLTQYSQMSQFFEATNAQLAHLQPLIRLFKVVPEGEREIQVPFKFNTFAEKDDIDMLQKKDKRGFGVGLENFSFTFDGNNPFAVKKSIEANLTIKAANFSELLRVRNVKGYSFRYIDLALKTGKSIKEKTGNKELDFRIKAVVGVAEPNGETTANFSSIAQAVKNNYVTLSLTPVTHTFDFDEVGGVVFKVEYRAYIEEYFDKARMNIFAQPEINKSVIERRLAIKTQKKNCTDEGAVKKLNEFIESDAEVVKREKIDSLKFLTTEMNKKKYIYFLSLTQKQLIDMVKNGPFASIGDIRDSIALEGTSVADMNAELEESFSSRYEELAGKGDRKSLENSFKLSGLTGKQIAFFYLGDLVDLILEKIDQNLANLADSISENYQGLDIDPELLRKEKEILTNSVGQFKKARVVLGPLEIVDHKDQSKSKIVSFADVPISLNYFNEWMTSKLLAKDQATYPLTQFLNDIMNDLVKNFLNDDSCFSFNTKQRVRVFQSTITSYRQPRQEHDDITTLAISDPRRRLNVDSTQKMPILNIGGHRNFRIGGMNPNLENHFFVYYAGRVQPKELMTGNRIQDQSRGIFHYILGRDRGIVKNIKLNKTDSPGLKEVRFEQEGYDGLYQLREIYDVNIDTFANIHTFPGTYIYVDPRGFSPSLGAIDLDKFDLTDLGIGGYYMIINSTHQFQAGTLNTSLTAKWVQSLDSTNPEDQKEAESSIGSGDVTVKKCSIATSGGA